MANGSTYESGKRRPSVASLRQRYGWTFQYELDPPLAEQALNAGMPFDDGEAERDERDAEELKAGLLAMRYNLKEHEWES